ncbi:MAG: hypothetical protein FWD65_02390 [Coriobacteriia bacterium]|nr:hypothetical protein [Coriobacteriia bacterium]
MTLITKDTTLKELASIVSTALEAAGVDAVLVGGAAVSFYSDNVYQTYDLDFITRHRTEVVAAALEPLGFKRKNNERHFSCPDTDFLVEFPSGELSFGETNMPIESTSVLTTPLGTIRVITPTQSVMDRLAAYIYWKDKPSFDQAVMIVKGNPIDWEQLFEWVRTEGADSEVIEKLKEAVSGSTAPV